MILLNLKNEDRVLKEQKLRENLEIELQAYKNQINPELLFQSLETIISELYRDKKSADDLINDLSKIYRYTLDNKHNDLVTLKEELESVKYLLSILNVRFHGKIKCNIQIDKDVLNLGIVPGVLAATENIITKNLPLEIMIKNNKNSVNISYKLKKHLMDFSTKNNRIDFIRKAYEYYSQGGFIIREEGQLRFFEIPLFEIEEEN
jgi:LytS/YehU family sensor histidine kinase